MLSTGPNSRSLKGNLWWPGLCTGVASMTTLLSPNTSLSRSTGSTLPPPLIQGANKAGFAPASGFGLVSTFQSPLPISSVAYGKVAAWPLWWAWQWLMLMKRTCSGLICSCANGFTTFNLGATFGALIECPVSHSVYSSACLIRQQLKNGRALEGARDWICGRRAGNENKAGGLDRLAVRGRPFRCFGGVDDLTAHVRSLVIEVDDGENSAEARSHLSSVGTLGAAHQNEKAWPSPGDT